MVLFAAAALTVATAAVPSQSTRVWPAGYDLRRGEDAMNTPFTVTSTSAPYNRVRNMTTLASGSLPFGPGTVITSLAFRRDAKYGSAYVRVNDGLLVVNMGQVRDAQRPDASFDRNWIGTPTQVAYLTSGVGFMLPDAPAPAGIAPFNLVVPLGIPFTYGGGDLGIDLQYSAPSTTLWRRDAMLVAAGVSNGAYAGIGAGCSGSLGRAPVAWPELDTAVPGGRLRVNLDEAPRPVTPYDSIAIALLGSSMTTLGGGVPLPLDLRSAGLGPSCMLRTNLLGTQVVVQSDPSREFGRAVAEWPVPLSLDLTGSVVFTQWLVLDSGVTSPTQMVVSNGIAISLGMADPRPRPLVGRTLWRYGSCDCTNGGAFSGAEYVAITQFTGTFR